MLFVKVGEALTACLTCKETDTWEGLKNKEKCSLSNSQTLINNSKHCRIYLRQQSSYKGILSIRVSFLLPGSFPTLSWTKVKSVPIDNHKTHWNNLHHHTRQWDCCEVEECDQSRKDCSWTRHWNNSTMEKKQQEESMNEMCFSIQFWNIRSSRPFHSLAENKRPTSSKTCFSQWNTLALATACTWWCSSHSPYMTAMNNNK